LGRPIFFIEKSVSNDAEIIIDALVKSIEMAKEAWPNTKAQ